MQLKQNSGSEMQFYMTKMQLNDFYKHAEDWNAVWKHAGAKMQFYKVKYAVKWFLTTCRGLKCNFETCRG